MEDDVVRNFHIGEHVFDNFKPRRAVVRCTRLARSAVHDETVVGSLRVGFGDREEVRQHRLVVDVGARIRAYEELYEKHSHICHHDRMDAELKTIGLAPFSNGALHFGVTFVYRFRHCHGGQVLFVVAVAVVAVVAVAVVAVVAVAVVAVVAVAVAAETGNLNLL